MNYQNFKTKSKLSIRLLFAVVFCSSILTIFSSIVQLFFDYKKGLNLIHDNIHFIETSYLPSIITSVYTLEEKQIENLLNGCLNFPDIEYLQITDTSNEVYKSVGNKPLGKDITQLFSLEYTTPSGKVISVGTLTLSASVKGLYRRIWEKAYIILLSNMVKTFFASILILFIINHIVVRHLLDISNFTRSLNLNKLDQKLKLNRQKSSFTKADEIDEVVYSINAMIQNIRNDTDKITKMKNALQEREKKYRTILLTAIDGFWITDIKGNLLEINNAYCQMSGYSKEELLAMTIPQLEANENFDEVEKHIEIGLKKGFDRFETIHKRKNGSLYDVEINFRYLYEEKIFVVFIKDITERKQSFEAIRKSNKEMKLAADSAHFGIWDLDIKENKLKWDDWMFRLYGIDRDKFGGAYEAWQAGVHPDDLDRSSSEVEKALNGEKKFDTEFRIVRPDGEIRWLKAHATVSRDSQGNPIQMTGINYDITDKKDLEARIQQSQKMEAIGNLAGGIAHDFNNILFPVVGMSELLLEDLPVGSVERENAEEILKAGKRGSALVKQILAFSRQSEHQMAPTRVQKVLKEVLNLARSTIPSDIEIKQDIQTDCGLIMADSTQIHQIAMNLVTNSYHAVETNGGRISVSLKEELLQTSDVSNSNIEPGRYAMLSISDTGEGIPPEILDKVFDPYFTTKERGKGTGLGLAVVHGIVKEYGGEIKVDTEIGKGTTFNIYIPLMDKTDTHETIEGRSDHPVGTERILLVDDEESISKLEKQMLERLGYQVTIRNSSPDALQTLKFSVESFDLVITDMTMPNMTGDKLAKEIIALRPDLPIIICTGFSERINQEKAEAFGIKGFLMKPVVKSELAKMVRKVLDESKS